MCELARNSVIQSGFEMEVKKRWLGKDWRLPGPVGNSEYHNFIGYMLILFEPLISFFFYYQ
jgi:adenosine deaminase